MSKMGPGFMITFAVSLTLLWGSYAYLNSIYQFA